MLVSCVALAQILHLLPYKGHEALGALLVFWVLVGKEFEHDLLLLVQAQSEGDGDEDKHTDTEDTARDRGSKRRKHDARIDRMAYEGIWAGRHKLVMFFHRWTRAPITPEINTRPNRKADTDCGKGGTDPTEGQRWRKDWVRKKHCS